MGLFGGFKAKFTKDTTAKNANKSAKKNDVVCLGYRVYSEFDEPPQYLSPQPGPSIRKQPTAIKTVLPRPTSSKSDQEINHINSTGPIHTQTQIITNPTAKVPAKKKAPILPNKSNNKPKQEPANLQESTSLNNIPETSLIEIRNRESKPNPRSAPSSVYIAGKTSSFNPAVNSSNTNNVTAEKISPKSILKSKSLFDLNTSDSNGNYLVISNHNRNGHFEDDKYDNHLMISKKSNESNGYNTETVHYLTDSQSVSKTQTTQVATYVHTPVSSSKDNNNAETNSSNSYSDDSYYTQNTRTLGGTSSYAANIFFGGDEEPEVRRPRRANLIQNEEDSAEC